MAAEEKHDQTPTKPVILGYWAGIRGIVEPIKCLLEYAGVPYTNETCPFLYSSAGSLEEGKAAWTRKRESLAKEGVPFPNLPYLIDGDLKLTQSIAIIRFLARRHGLDVPDSDPAAVARLEVIERQVDDFRWNFIYYCLGEKYVGVSWDFLEAFPKELELFSRCLGDRTWLMGDRLTYIDFMLYEIVDQCVLFQEGCLDTMPNLKEHAKRFRMLTPIKAYLESERFRPWPILLPNAKRWGAQKDPPKSLKSYLCAGEKSSASSLAELLN